ncbi:MULTISPECIES: DUF6074 family protein [unclassified Bradyrhizobium]|uniref:DUF6074 family protein n=1 Tax=unclassified Bradyrhizobium TaxID=2631580 RepID=UPI0029169F02|nr:MULTISPECIES: DUF6074 family protein [unclassified Bradyrhizobium]
MKRRSKAVVHSAPICLFPSSRHRRIVRFIAAEMRKQPSIDAAEDYLISHLNIEWERLADLGACEDEADRHCRAFAIAAWRVFYAGQSATGIVA